MLKKVINLDIKLLSRKRMILRFDGHESRKLATEFTHMRNAEKKRRRLGMTELMRGHD